MSFMKNPFGRHLPVVLIAGTLTGCFGTNSEALFGTREGAGKRDPLAALAEFPGCVDGYALSPSRIHLEFAFPPDASMMRIYRDGIQIMSTHISTTTTYVDENLNEGREYTYTCEASIRGVSKLGTNILKIETDSVNPPTFEGIKSAVALGPTSVRVTWNPPGLGSVAAKTYRIYANMGGTLNWNAAPRATLNEGAKQYTLTGLGDELPYIFGVEACSSAGNCARGLSGASVTLGVTTPDGSAPQTVGPVSATATNSYVHLSAPWSESNGALKRRRVYQKLGALSTNIGDYTLVYTSALISDPTTPPTTLSVSGVLENTQYHYIVVDEDPIGNTKQSAILSYLTGDLTPPTFSGASSALLVAPKDSSVQLSFTAVNRQWPGGEDTADGTAYYVIYTASLPYATYSGNPGSLPDACGASGTLWGQPISSQTYAPGAQTYTMTGLTERTTYSVCLKARDFAGNVSTGSTALTITTIDITPPVFDGIQALSFDTPTAKLILGWNPTSSNDIKEYKIELWQNVGTYNLSPAGGDITTFIRSHGAPHNATTGVQFSTSDYSMGDAKFIHSVVRACDTGADLPGGQQNCSSFAYSTAKYFQLPDITPPPGFLGIKGPAFQDSASNGQMTVRWFEPSPWTADYYGFKIFHYNGSGLQLLKDCACATPGSCNAGDVECTVTDLDAYRNYNLHVRAVDAVGNQSPLDPAVFSSQRRTLDTLAPTYSSSLQVGASPTFALSWSDASDNQYEGNITYEIYRKQGATFGAPTNPAADGTLRGTTTNLTYTDAGLSEGETYYFTVCARDMSNNKTCDGYVRNLTVPDITPPVIGSFTSNHAEKKKRWDLSWSMSDNFTPQNNLQASIYQSNTDTPSTATKSDALIYQNTGTLTATNISGPLNALKYVNYLLVIRDLGGNESTSALTVLSDNRITLTSVKRNNGPTTGGKILHLTGTGFSISADNNFGADTTVSIDGVSCGSVQIVNSTHLLCTNGASGAGMKDVVITNPEGSSSTLFGGYQYENPPTHICDRPGDWGAEMAAGTAGTSFDPFIICNPAHLQRLADNIGEDTGGTGTNATKNYRTGGFTFQLADNIDLNGVTWTPIGTSASPFSGVLKGDGHIVSNLTFSDSNMDNVGLFGYAATGFSASDLGLVGFSVTGRTYVGLLLGTAGVAAGSITLSDLFVAASDVTGTSYVGGLAGRFGVNTNHPGTISNVYADVEINASGGFIGGLVGGALTTTLQNIEVNVIVTNGLSNAGGLVGYPLGVQNITDATVHVQLSSTNNNNAGGVFGSVNAAGSTLTRVRVTGNITGSGRTGGLVGAAVQSVTITDCHVSAIVSAVANATGHAGGLVGYGAAVTTITGSSYTAPSLNSASHLVGGLFGTGGTAQITESFAATNIIITGTVGVGGIAYAVGTAGEVKRSYFKGSILVTPGVFTQTAGGILSIADGKITDSYASGSIGGTEHNTGGIAGRIAATAIVNRAFHVGGALTGNITESRADFGTRSSSLLASVLGVFWNTDDAGSWAQYYSGAGVVEGKTTTEMQDRSGSNGIWGPAGYDFTSGTPVWKWCGGSGGYPRLVWETCP